MISPLEVFCCYARKDQLLLNELKIHLSPLQRRGLITIWSDIDIDAGAVWEKEIKKHLNTAQIILLLISPDFMASEYCYSTEMQRALERHEQKEAHVIPILLRPTIWKDAPFDKLQVLPTNAKPVTDRRSWLTEDEALNDVVEGIRKVVTELMLPPPDLPPPPSPTDVIAQAKRLEKQFQANDYTGISNNEPLLIVNGSVPVVLSCPQAVAHYIDGKRIDPHLYTGTLTMQIAERTNSHALIYARCERTSDEVPGWMEVGPYKRQLTNLIQMTNAYFVLDMQGSHKSIEGDVLIGTIGEKSLLDKPYLLDILKGILRKAGLTSIIVDRAKYGFDAKGEFTITRYTSEKHNTPAMQITIARKFRDVYKAPHDYVLLLNTLSDAVIEMYKACSDGKH